MANSANDRTAIKLQYQVCPIILTAGVAENMPGGLIPMLAMFSNLGISGTVLGALQGLNIDQTDLDDAFGAFNVLPGGTLVSQAVAKYPFANQWVAANATIREPLTLSVIMDAPMRGPNAFQVKRTIMATLKGVLDYHNNAGGTYTVVTPAFMYQNMIMTAMTDNSRGNNSLPQNAWRFDFEKPLVALSDLQESLNLLNAKINNQVPVTPNISGLQVGSDAAQTQFNTNAPLPAMSPEFSFGGVPLPSSMASVFGNLTSGVPTSLTSNLNMFGVPTILSSGAFPFSGIS